jgi:hypothetical protein
VIPFLQPSRRPPPPLRPPDGHEPFSLARPQWPPAGCAPHDSTMRSRRRPFFSNHPPTYVGAGADGPKSSLGRIERLLKLLRACICGCARRPYFSLAAKLLGRLASFVKWPWIEEGVMSVGECSERLLTPDGLSEYYKPWMR